LTTKIIYQTLEDRGGNIKTLVNNGPYVCSWENSWFGDGYYFWDTFIKNAHWWGKSVRRYTKGYVICRAECDYNDVDCCDLVGNTEHMQMFSDAYFFLKQKGLVDANTTVKRIVKYLKDDINVFKFQAIRAYGVRSKGFNSEYSCNVFFEEGKASYMDFNSAIQICFYSKDSLNLRNFNIIFPEEYVEDYVV
jgi:hypothetical protein